MTIRLGVLIVASMVLLVGCAKKPTMIGAAAPPPSGASVQKGGDQVRPASQPDRATPPRAAMPGTTGRAHPGEYSAIGDLTDIHFDFDRYDIRLADAKRLDANAAWLKTNANHLLLIEGHCDERGTTEYNVALGERRAKATMNYLVAQGVAANRVTIVSYGEERPECSQHDEACWAKNRRAHFLVKRQ